MADPDAFVPRSDVEGYADKLIREATARGDFDDLVGQGRPLGRLNMDPDWWIRSFLEREQLPERQQDVLDARDALVKAAVAEEHLADARELLARANGLVRAWNDEAPTGHEIEERSEVWLLDQRDDARPTGRASSGRDG